MKKLLLVLSLLIFVPVADSRTIIIDNFIGYSSSNGSSSVYVLPNGTQVFPYETGWADYVDGEYNTSNRFTASNGVLAIFPNDGAGATTRLQYMPEYINESGGFYNGSHIIGREGDAYGIGLRFSVEPQAVNTYCQFFYNISGAVGQLPSRLLTFPKGQGVEEDIKFYAGEYTLNTWEANGAQVEVLCEGGDVEFWGISYEFFLLSRANTSILFDARWIAGDFLLNTSDTLSVDLSGVVGNIGNWSSDQSSYLRNDGDTATGNYDFDSGTLFVDSVNNRVGIGTDSPQSPLHIHGGGTEIVPFNSASFLTGLQFQKTDSATGAIGVSFFSGVNGTNQITFGDTDSQFSGSILYNHRVDSLDFRTSNAVRLFISSEGDVGLGTSSPSAKLETLLDNAGISDLDAVFSRYGSGGVTFIARSSGGTEASPTGTADGQNVLVFQGRGHDGTQWMPSADARIRMKADGATNATNRGMYFTFDATDEGSTSRTDAILSVRNSKVGVNTETPSVDLDITGTYQASNQYFSAYDATGGTSIGTSYTNITFDTEDREDTLYTHATDSSIITINDAGDYEVSAQCAMDVTGTARYTGQWRLVLDGTEMEGSLAYSYHRTNGNGADSMSITRLFTASDGSTLTVQGLINSAGAGATTEANACRIMVKRI